MAEAPHAEPLVTVRDVVAGYGRRVILDRVSAEVPAAAVTALVGVNGSGKTTLLRVILGLIRARSGSVTFAGGRRPALGYVPQIDASEVLFPVTATEVVVMGRTPGLSFFGRPKAADREAARAALARFAVGDLAERPFRSLSGGQRQRVLLARAVVSEPELLVLDEPVRGLDFASSASLLEALVSVATENGAGVLVATHSLDLVANHADHLILCKQGEVQSGPASELFNDEVLTRYHDHPVRVVDVDGRRVVLPGA